jgi:glycine/D-amino acid oxidase-like deaminating enzyme
MLMRTMLARAQALGIAQYGGISIAEMVESTTGVQLHTTAGWTFHAGRVLVATNGFATQLMPELAVVPARNQVLVTAPIPDLALRGAFHYDKGYVYFRNVGDRILLGGGRNQDIIGETSTELLPHGPIRDYLTELLHTLVVAPAPIVIARWWSGIMGVGAQKQPIVQPVGRHTVVAVRMGGMGVAIGTQIGEDAAELLLH